MAWTRIRIRIQIGPNCRIGIQIQCTNGHNIWIHTQNYRRQNRKEYKGKTNLAQSELARLLWLLYRPSSTHRPHVYPTRGRAWGMGLVRGCARAVPSRPPSPCQDILHCGNPTLRKQRCRHRRTFLFCPL